jgi:Prp8 binding protein
VQAQGVQRTSGLTAPTMLLTGHAAPVYSLTFDPSGKHLASGSFDKSILLWDVYGEGGSNYNVLRGHKNAVLQVHWSADGAYIASASADKTVGLWDANKGTRKRLYKGHSKVVNSCTMSRTQNLIVSGSDDGSVRVWDARDRKEAGRFDSGYQVTAVELGASDLHVFSSGIDNAIKCWDMRKGTLAYTMEGHADTVTGLALSPSGASLLSNGMDRTVREWDIRPYAAGDRCAKTFTGATHAADKNLLGCSWSSDGAMVSAGSADKVVHIWDEPSGQELYYLPGHTGTVNDCKFHPKEPIIASCGSDKNIYLGEI